MYWYGEKGITNWLDDKTRNKGATKYNLEFLRLFKQLDAELGRINTISYFCVKRLGIKNANAMLSSAKKQRALIKHVEVDLKKYAVTDEWTDIFNKSIDRISARCDYLFKILKENIRLTKYHLYFTEVGYDKLIDFSFVRTKSDNFNDESIDEELMTNITQYNKRHQTAIDDYMKSIENELHNIEIRRKNIAENEKREKEAKRLARKISNDEVKEIKKNKHKAIIENRKTERMFDYLYTK
jgi:hypothetical protein